MQQFNMGSDYAAKKGIVFSKTVLFLIALGFATSIVVCVIATYYGKKCPNCNHNSLKTKCNELFCSEQSQNIGKQKILKKILNS